MTTPESSARSPFHAGERAVQARLGVQETMESWGSKVIRSWMPKQHREFYTGLPFVVAAARDALDRPWVTILTGEPGFVGSPSAETLDFRSEIASGDALHQSLLPGANLGLLGIDFETRRRNRVNGTVTETGLGTLRLRVGQAFGNCPQYITARSWRFVDVAPDQVSTARHHSLTDSMQQWISSADTFFIGSGIRADKDSPSNGMDASHRGGPPGFVKVENSRRLVFPDYAGNNHFNTIGNLVLDPRVALLFVDFDNGDLLQITGQARIDWESPDIGEHPGAQRLVWIDIDAVVEQRGALPLRFFEPEGQVRELRLVGRKRESDDVVSFYFKSRDGGELPDFDAGQHLPLEIPIAGQRNPVKRTYSLSNAPGQGHYRISVKRERNGVVSRLLHDSVDVGSVLNSRPPAGDFVVGDHSRPVVLLSAGIGVTPMISMLGKLTAEPSDRPIVFLHGARDGRHHPLAQEVRKIAAENGNVTVQVAYSQPLAEDIENRDFDVAGRIDEKVLRACIPELDAEYFLCGPASFLSAMTDVLSGLGVAEDSVHVEQF